MRIKPADFRKWIVIGIVALGLVFAGFWIAGRTKVSNDEIFSQVFSVEGLSFSQILAGEIREGNATPLFYLLQKAVTELSGYTSPKFWHVLDRDWGYDQPIDRILLRFVPVILGSVMIGMIFIYFWTYHGFPAAAFSLSLSLLTPMFITFWAQARPYALWMFLTTVQILLFFRLIETRDERLVLHSSISLVHFFLALTVVLSVPQISVICFLLWIYGKRSKTRYVFLWVLPVSIAVVYYFLSPNYPFGFIFNIEQYIRANIPRERFYVASLFIAAILVRVLAPGERIRDQVRGSIKQALPALAVLGMMVAAALAILLAFYIKQSPERFFPVTEKYLIFLAPVGVITTTVLADALVRSLRSRPVQWAVVLIIAGIIAVKSVKFLKIVLKDYAAV